MDSITIDRLDKRINDMDFKYHEQIKKIENRIYELGEIAIHNNKIDKNGKINDMDMTELCNKVAENLGWQLQDWITAGRATCNNGPHWMEKIKNTWHPVVYGDGFMEPDDLLGFLLSAEGRELLENHANNKLDCFPAIAFGKYGFVNFIEWTETQKFSIFTDDKLNINRACLLAFASLTGILTKNVELTED